MNEALNITLHADVTNNLTQLRIYTMRWEEHFNVYLTLLKLRTNILLSELRMTVTIQQGKQRNS